MQCEGGQAEVAQAAAVDSIPEVVDDKDSVTEPSDGASVHDMDYVNPRGVRFTQSTQRDGREMENSPFWACICLKNGTVLVGFPLHAYFPLLGCFPGVALIPYGLPCLRELFRFLISLTNPHDRHNTDAMIHMGLQLLTVALESAHIVNYQSLLVLVKDELCRHLFQVRKKEALVEGLFNFSWHISPFRISKCLLS